MKIGSLDTSKRVMIVAEIGNNHEGDFELAQKMIRLAAEAGADAVKFQAIIPEELVTPEQSKRLAMLHQFRFTAEQFIALSHTAHEFGLLFLISPFAIRFISPLTTHVDAFKIASGDNTFYPLINAVAHSGKPVIISTGLLDPAGIQNLHQYLLRQMPSERFALLHCVCSYPTPDYQANLAAIHAMTNFIATVGYSDHTIGIDAAVLSVAAGARIIEKHFTIDKNYSDFRDHRLSADPDELQTLISRIRQAELFLTPTGKIPQSCEQTISVRRSIAARQDLPLGHVLTWENISWLRPENGLLPGQEAELLGRRLKQAVKTGQYLTPNLVS